MKDFIDGYISGSVGIIITHPIDTIKNKIQSGSCSYKEITRGLYKGLLPAIIGIGIEKSCVFGTYNHINFYINNHMISGLISGMISSPFISYIEFNKISKQLSHGNHYNKVSKGLKVTMLRDSIGYGIYFSMYNSLINDEKEPLWIFISGGLSGMVSWLIIYPIDLVKTRIQSGIDNSSIYNQLTDIIKKGKIYNGLKYALLRAFVLHGSVFGTFEIIKKYRNNFSKKN